VKLGLPVYGKYSGSNAVLTASGYYPEYDQTEIWQNDLGYGIFNLNGKKEKLDLGVSAMGTLETGAKWNTGIGTALYTGVFVDYGFNDMKKSSYSEKRFVEYNHNEPAQPLMNTACVLADKFSPLSFGVKLKLAFSVGCRDWLNDRKAYQTMQSEEYDDYFDFSPEIQPQMIDTIPFAPVVVPADTIPAKILELPKRGRITFSTDDIYRQYPSLHKKAVTSVLRRLVENGKIQSVWHGFYVVVPVEYELKGVVPPVVYIDRLMEYLQKDYYIGLLNAASFYGAAHQQPQEFTVITDGKNLRDKLKNGVKINFVSKKEIPHAFIRKNTTKTGYVSVSSPCLTALDLLLYQKEIGGLSRAGTVLNELVEEMEIDE
jgi:hypothetical protein